MALNHPLFYGWHKVIDMHQITSWARIEIDFAEKKSQKVDFAKLKVSFSDLCSKSLL